MGEAAVDFEDTQLQATIVHMYEAFPKGKIYERALKIDLRGAWKIHDDLRIPEGDNYTPRGNY